MSKSTNPYTLLFGKKPVQFISRFSQTDIIIDAFRYDPPLSQVYMITGVRGSGKTVLMTYIANHLKESDDFIVLNLNPTRDMLQAMAAKLYANRLFSPFLTELNVDFSLLGIGISIKKADKISDIESAIEILLNIAKKLKKKILVTIDEVVNDQHMKEFVSAFQIFIREDLPIYLLMTGLYENIQRLQDNKSLTFLYRAPKINLMPLNINAIKNSYQNTLKCTDEEAQWLAKQTKGYPFAFQVLGYLCWEQNDHNFTNVIPQYMQYLEEYSYEKIWSELSATEQKIVAAMSSGEVQTVKSIREQLGFSSDKFTVYRTRLLKKGLIIDPGYGELALTLPYFREFIMSKSVVE